MRKSFLISMLLALCLTGCKKDNKPLDSDSQTQPPVTMAPAPEQTNDRDITGCYSLVDEYGNTDWAMSPPGALSFKQFKKRADPL